MKNRFFKRNSIWVFWIMTMFLFSCQDDWESEKSSEGYQKISQPVVQANLVTADLPGRTLAANCFQCHGTNGYAGELKIAGESSSEIISELNEMKSKNPGSNIMNVHAKAYTTEEIKLIADFFSKQ